MNGETHKDPNSDTTRQEEQISKAIAPHLPKDSSPEQKLQLSKILSSSVIATAGKLIKLPIVLGTKAHDKISENIFDLYTKLTPKQLRQFDPAFKKIVSAVVAAALISATPLMGYLTLEAVGIGGYLASVAVLLRGLAAYLTGGSSEPVIGLVTSKIDISKLLSDFLKDNKITQDPDFLNAADKLLPMLGELAKLSEPVAKMIEDGKFLQQTPEHKSWPTEATQDLAKTVAKLLSSPLTPEAKTKLDEILSSQAGKDLQQAIASRLDSQSPQASNPTTTMT